MSENETKTQTPRKPRKTQPKRRGRPPQTKVSDTRTSVKMADQLEDEGRKLLAAASALRGEKIATGKATK